MELSQLSFYYPNISITIYWCFSIEVKWIRWAENSQREVYGPQSCSWGKSKGRRRKLRWNASRSWTLTHIPRHEESIHESLRAKSRQNNCIRTWTLHRVSHKALFEVMLCFSSLIKAWICSDRGFDTFFCTAKHSTWHVWSSKAVVDTRLFCFFSFLF